MTSFVKPLDPPPFYTTPWDLYASPERSILRICKGIAGSRPNAKEAGT